MVDIKDIAMMCLTNLSEGILDDIEVTMAQGDQFIDIQYFEKWSEKCRNKAYWRPTKKGWVLQGDFIINNLKDKTYSGPMIKTVKGNIYIMNSEIETLEGLFFDNAVIEGSLTIQNCKNLISLKGCPAEVQTLTIMECSKLKSLENGPVVLRNLYAMKNGKKFKEEDLRNQITVNKNIFCSQVNDEDIILEGMINESLRNPHLIRLAKQLKEPKYRIDKDWTLEMVLRDRNLYLDKLDSDSFKEYDGSDPRALTLARKAMANDLIIILCMNDKGRYTYLIHGHSVTNIDFNENDRWAGRMPRWGSDTSVHNLENIIKKSDTVIIIDYNGEERNWKLKNQRMDARKGALALNRGEERSSDEIDAKYIRYYQGIANENRERYKKLVAIIKAQRNLTGFTASFEKLKKRIDNVMERYTQLMVTMLKYPEKYSSWDIDYVTSKIKSHYTSAKARSTVSTGLLVLLDRYMHIYIESRKGDINVAVADSKLKELESEIESTLDQLENKITKLENNAK